MLEFHLKPEVQEDSEDQDISSSIRPTCLPFRRVLAGVQACEPADKGRPWIGRLDVEVFRVEIRGRVATTGLHLLPS
jgi:hypothetical protein